MPSRRHLLGAGAAGLATLAGCSALDESPYSPGTDAESEWPMPGYDRGYSAYARDAAAPRTNVTERWSTEIRSPSGRPVVAEGLVFAPTVTGLLALDAATGEEVWSYAPSEQPWPTSPVVHDGTVFVGFGDQHHLAALDAATGEKAWQHDTRGNVRTAPTLSYDGHRVVVGDDTGMVYLVEPDRGAEYASFEVYGPVRALAFEGGPLVGTEGGEVYALFEDSRYSLIGLWRRKLDGMITAISAAGSVLAVGTFGGPVYRLQDGAHAGRSRWEYDFTANHLANTGSDVVGVNPSGLATLQYRTGSVEWKKETGYEAGPAIAGDTLYVGGGDRDGKSYVDAYPVEGGLGVADYRLGDRGWRFRTDSPVTEGLAVADGAVFALTAGGEDTSPKAYALESP
jgi:outer membrane protein assembly factor BamB